MHHTSIFQEWCRTQPCGELRQRPICFALFQRGILLLSTETLQDLMLSDTIPFPSCCNPLTSWTDLTCFHHVEVVSWIYIDLLWFISLLLFIFLFELESLFFFCCASTGLGSRDRAKTTNLGGQGSSLAGLALWPLIRWLIWVRGFVWKYQLKWVEVVILWIWITHTYEFKRQKDSLDITTQRF